MIIFKAQFAGQTRAAAFDPKRIGFEKVTSRMKNLTPFFKATRSYFFNKWMKETFRTEGGSNPSGAWAGVDTYSRSYAKFKRKVRRGRLRPVLVLRGRLKKSLTSMSSPDAIGLIRGNTLELGTKVPYASAHHFGRNNQIRRPIIEASDGDARAIIKFLQAYLITGRVRGVRRRRA